MLAEARRIDGVAGTASVTPDFGPVAERIRDEATDDWDDKVAVERFEAAGGTFVRGAGALAGRDGADFVVTVGEQRFTAPRVVLATGTAPAVPLITGLRELHAARPDLVWTNRDAVKAAAAPQTLIVLGGGAIGCEFAQGFARYGSTVTVVEAGERLLTPEEPDAAAVIDEVFTREGIEVRTGVGATAVAEKDGHVEVTLASGNVLTAAILLVAVGRSPNLRGIGLDTVGLADDLDVVPVNDHLEVDGIPGLYAVGDITGHGAFTHVAMWQADVLIDHLLDRPANFGGYQGLAWATFTDPEVGRVGMTEQQAREAGLTVRVGVQQVASNSRGWIHGPGNDGFVKVVEDADRGVLVGATVVAPNGGEILGLLTLAVHAAVPVRTLASMHYAFPTIHRAVKEAVVALA